MIRLHDADRIRTITLDRPEALNAFNEALYDATTEALIDAAADPGVAVVLLTGTGRAFSAGTDVAEMAEHGRGTATRGRHGFNGLVDQLAAFPKPLVCAVNGLALGVGATMLGYADLVFMSTDARLRCPFTALGVAPEAGSSFTFPLLLGRQRAAWVLMSSEWLTAEECVRIGLVWRACAPDRLLPEATEYARVLASKPLASLIGTKRTIISSSREAIAQAREREHQAFRRLLGGPANVEALTALAARREPDFVTIDAQHPVVTSEHAT